MRPSSNAGASMMPAQNATTVSVSGSQTVRASRSAATRGLMRAFSKAPATCRAVHRDTWPGRRGDGAPGYGENRNDPASGATSSSSARTESLAPCLSRAAMLRRTACSGKPTL